MNGFALMVAAVVSFADPPPADVVVVVGAPGTSEFGEVFARSATAFRDAAERGGAACETIGQTTDEALGLDREQLQATVERLAPAAERGTLWLVLFGHGTYDGREAKFNLRGPDASAMELNAWLASAQRPVVIVNCASASGPFLNALSAPNRVVVTATRSGNEVNFARFGEKFAEAIGDSGADLDKDQQVSLLEAFLVASGRTAEFYRDEGRLATEHALLDDNGDQLGTSADWFVGVRATKRAKEGAALDGGRAHQLHLVPSAGERELPTEARQRRDELEAAVEALRAKKVELGDDAYYAELEKLMVELAAIYASSDSPAQPAP